MIHLNPLNVRETNNSFTGSSEKSVKKKANQFPGGKQEAVQHMERTMKEGKLRWCELNIERNL